MRRLLLVAAAALLAACGPTAEPEAPAAPVPPAPAVLPEAPAAPSAPVLTPSGYGVLRIGMTRAEIVQAMGGDSDPAAVSPEPERCDQFRPVRAPEGLLVMVEEGRLTRISLLPGSGLKTDRGLGPGDTAAAVKAAYGASAVVTPHEYEDAPAEYVTVWTARAARSAPYVKDPNARGLVYEVGGDGRVRMVHGGGPAIQYVEGCS